MYYLKKNKKDDGALSETLTTQIKDKAEVVFNLLDSDDDGHLRYEDIEAFVASCDQGFQEGSDIEETKKNAKDVFARMDKSGDGKINMKEWMVWITVLYPTMAERTALFNIVEGPSRRPTLLPPPAPSGPPSTFCFPSMPSAVCESDTAVLMGVPSVYTFEVWRCAVRSTCTTAHARVECDEKLSFALVCPACGSAWPSQATSPWRAPSPSASWSSRSRSTRQRTSTRGGARSQTPSTTNTTTTTIWRLAGYTWRREGRPGAARGGWGVRDSRGSGVAMMIT